MTERMDFINRRHGFYKNTTKRQLYEIAKHLALRLTGNESKIKAQKILETEKKLLGY